MTDHQYAMLNEFLRDEFYTMKFGGKSKEAAYLASSELRKYIAKTIQESIDENVSSKMVILSTHDTLIAALMSAMGLE